MTDKIPGFSRETFARRRRRLMEEMGDGILILPAAPLLFRSRDTAHRYRPDSDLFYLTGCTEPEVVAVFGGGQEPEKPEDAFVLFVPDRDPRVELWTGPRMAPQEARERFGAMAAHPLKELGARLPALLKEPRKVFCRLGIHPELDGMVLEAMREARTRGARKGDGPRAVADPGELLGPLRMRKDAQELAAIRQAADLTVAGFRAAMAEVHEGMGEWEVESVLEATFRRGGGSGPAFPTIVGAGANACVLHYAANGDRIPEGGLVLLDGGAEKDLYAGDVTRTFPAGGSFRGSQEEVYRVVLEAHRAAIAEIRPGNPVSRVHEAATTTLVRGLTALGILSGREEDLVRERAWEPYFPHQTSHWLGLDVHDVGDYARRGTPTLLEPGMVLTVEPGLYFNPERTEIPEAFRGIGIRIEDDMVVTEDGAENLTEALPTSPEGVAGLVGTG
ncbi:MAG: aminopeptidase P N-terminal domain-containing protein [Gemmatimonadota bacterium]